MKLYYTIPFLFLLNCDSVHEANIKQINQISYYKDVRTNLCFAVSYINSSQLSLDRTYSNVPCTQEVEKLISEQK